jgi:predicted transcriptional regulator
LRRTLQGPERCSAGLVAEQLGIKEQQLQRYEADNFTSVTFKNLIRFLDAIGLEITIKETRMTRTNKNKSRKKQSPK